MDPSECIQILNNRVKCAHPDNVSNNNLNHLCIPCSSYNDEDQTQVVNLDELNDLLPFELVTLFFDLQSQRIQSYADFNAMLKLLIDEFKIEEYPILCAEMTARFSVISEKIKAISISLRKLSFNQIADLIQKVQSGEKEKLTLVAADHLEKILIAYPSLQRHIGTEPQPAYIADKIRLIEINIAENMEIIQIEKCDIV